ncbi:MAG TPA: histidinol-phosphatase [Pyrinomonadaceae bacterium]|nr:histidinol-phosphatase [Pyrinomonadaceae bacterium]
MTIPSDELQRLLEFAVTIAREAGDLTLNYFRSQYTIENKADGSEVTAADREAEAHLRARISRQFPDDEILGEEQENREGTSGRRWIIDPIDGTFSFVRGVPMFGVLIALADHEDVVLGVVNLPASREMVYAARGLGCFGNGERVRVSSTETLGQALLLSTDFGTAAAYGFGRATEELERRVKARRTWGDCYGHILVATGRADIMLDPIMNLWDCAPLLPILEEAGGTFTDWNGKPGIDGGNAISTNGKLFDQVMQIVRENS